jgi:hypothetical protein
MSGTLRRHRARTRSRNERNELMYRETAPLYYGDMETHYVTRPIPLSYGTPPMARRIPPGTVYDTISLSRRIGVIGWKFTAYVAFTAIGSIVGGLLVIGGIALAWKYA